MAWSRWRESNLREPEVVAGGLRDAGGSARAVQLERERGVRVDGGGTAHEEQVQHAGRRDRHVGHE